MYIIAKGDDELNEYDLDQYLRKEHPIEIVQKERVEPMTDEELKAFYGKTHEPMESKLLEQRYFKKGDIFIDRHSRYIRMPEHQHAFLEMNYVYSGQSTQWIDGKKVELKKGDILMLDRGSSHALEPLGEGDILLNILLKSDAINTTVLHQMVQQRSLMTDFLIRASHQQQEAKQYLLFRTGDNPRVQICMLFLLTDYFSSEDHHMEKIKLWLPIIFSEMAASFDQDTKQQAEPENEIILSALKIIEEEYQSIDLDQLAQRMGFNKNYLGNRIKADTGLTFKDWVQKQRMQKAHDLLLHTNYSMEEIAYQIGLSSTSYFFRSFKKQFGQTPGELRQTMVTDL